MCKLNAKLSLIFKSLQNREKMVRIRWDTVESSRINWNIDI